MVKIIELPINSTFRDFGEQAAVEISIDRSSVKDLIAAFQLLKEQHVSIIEFKTINSSLFIKSKYGQESRCLELNAQRGKYKFEFGTNLLDYFMRYLLIYFRDGVAEAQHIDLDFDFEDRIVTLIVKSENFIARMGSGIEAFIQE